MSISILLILLLYILYILLFFIFMFFNLYHMIRFSFWNRTGYVATFLYIIISLTTLFFSAIYLWKVDWSQELELFTSFGVIPSI